jgi:hypothetical protein
MPSRRVGSPYRILAVAAVLGAGCALPAVAAGAGGTISGALEFEQGTAPDVGRLAYRFDAAPLLDARAASAAVELTPPLRPTDSRFAVMEVTRFTATPTWIAQPEGCEGRQAFAVAQSIALVDARALLAVHLIRLDVVRGRGTADVTLASVGADAYSMGSYPASGVMQITTDGCVDAEGTAVPDQNGGPFHAVERVSAVGGFLRPSGVEALQNQAVKLRRVGGVWRGSATLANAADRFGPAARTSLELELRGTPVQLDAFCTLPSVLYTGSGVAQPGAAARLLRDAGFARPRFAATPSGGRYRVTGVNTNSLPCDGRLRVARTAG